MALRARGVAAEASALARVEPRAKKALDRPAFAGSSTDEKQAWHYFNLVLEQAGIARSAATDAALFDQKAWHDAHNLWEDVPAGVRPSLERVRAPGLRVAVVSNANGTSGALLDRLGLASTFDVILDSAVEGWKPDPRLFHLALERLGAAEGGGARGGHVPRGRGRGAGGGIRPVLLDERASTRMPTAPGAVARGAADHIARTGATDISAKLPATR
jgi:hypothetical protein